MKTGKVIADKFNEIAAKLESNFRLFLCEKSYHLVLRDCKHETYVGIIRNIYSMDDDFVGEVNKRKVFADGIREQVSYCYFGFSSKPRSILSFLPNAIANSRQSSYGLS